MDLPVDWPESRAYVPRRGFMADILVVDDSKVMREMLIACLRGRQDLSFTQASSGLEAIEYLSLKPYDLLLLDLNMPDIGGIEVVEFVRAQDRLRSIPIIVVTTRGDDTSRERALKAGATRYLTKPFAPEVIQAEVASALGPAKALA
jgi:two-component system, chemotaxis family, chemotaxis protein CheY